MATPICPPTECSTSCDVESEALGATQSILETRSTSPSFSQKADVASLALQACDDVDRLREVLCAYTCLEKLIAPLEMGDTERVSPTRSELSALVCVINEEMGRRIGSIDEAVQSMHSVLSAA